MSFKKSQGGFTLIELVVVIAIFAVVVAIALPSARMVRKYRVASSTSQLVGDLEAIRSQSLTSGSGPNSRGFGIEFPDASGTSYTRFEFNDCNGDFDFDDDGCAGSTTEALNPKKTELPSDIYITDGNAAMTAGEMLLYCRKGMARGGTWGIKGATYVVRHKDDAIQPRCVSVSAVRIREGMWNGSACN